MKLIFVDHMALTEMLRQKQLALIEKDLKLTWGA